VLRGHAPPIAYQGTPGSCMLARVHLLGAIAAACAVLLGLGYMAAAGAPMRLLAINAAALAAGLVLLTAGLRVARMRLPWDVLMLAASLALLATALSGLRIEGAARWAPAGPLVVQPSLIVLPAMIVGFARSPGMLATVAMLGAALALALQPDRAMAGVLAAGMAALAFFRPEGRVLAVLAASLAAFGVTLWLPDRLPAVPFVDQVYVTAFAVHPLAGAAVVGGAILLLLPVLAGWRSGSDRRESVLVFGAVRFAIALAAALGNYPTPLVGYGGSAILGYLLSLVPLPGQRVPSR